MHDNFATHLNIEAKIGAFYFGKNASSVFAPILACKKMCRSIWGYAFFGCVASATHFFIQKEGGF